MAAKLESEYIDGTKEEIVTALMVHSAVNNESYFSFGNLWVNQIHQNIVQTEKNCLQGIAADCHQRDERLGWMNDATVRFEETPYNFNVSRLFPKIVADAVEEQTEAGDITCTAPCIYARQPSGPVCAAFLIAGWQVWLHYGSPELIQRHYQNFSKWADFLKAHELEEEPGIISYSYYGDWAGAADSCHSVEGPWSVVTPGILMSTGFHYYDHKTVVKMARFLGNSVAEYKYKEEKQTLTSGFHRFEYPIA